jgi:hypothetical protein
MSNVIEFPSNEDDEILYTVKGDKVNGVKHSSWNFWIQFDQGIAGLISEVDGQTFGELDKRKFSEVLLCYLLIADPDLVDSVCQQCDESKQKRP